MEHSLKLAASGDVIERENAVAIESIPAEVKAALTRKFPKGEIKEAEEVNLHFYEFEIKTGNKKREVKVSAAGQILGNEDEDDDDDE